MSETRAFQVRLSRHGVRDSLIVVGDIARWLTDKGARATRNGFNVRGWRCTVAPISRDELEHVAAIVGPNSAAANALRQLDAPEARP